MNDLERIGDLTAEFFSVFTNLNGQLPQIERLQDLFIKEGLLLSSTRGQTVIP